MENEIMEYEEFGVMDEAVETDESTGISTGVAMLIGAGVACVVGAGVKLVKKGIEAYKAKKEARKSEHEFVVDDTQAENVAEK